jgi:16S rRNA (uracil1498-N3)-methyltransferase
MRAGSRATVTARRLYAPELAAPGDVIELPVESVRHAQVLRLAAGAALVLFDGQLGEADAELLELGRTRARARVLARRTLPAPLPALHVVLGMPKGGKLEDIARMLGELGVSSLRLAHSERSVARLDQPAARLARLGRVALEACAQSGRGQALVVHPPAALLEVAGQAPADALRQVFWENARAPLPAGNASALRELWAVIGPEGGLAEHEVSALESLGYRAVGLGPARLRVETAAPVIAGLLLERHGRLQ